MAAGSLLGLVEEGVEVFADDLVQDGAFGITGPVANAGHGQVVTAGEGAGKALAMSRRLPVGRVVLGNG